MRGKDARSIAQQSRKKLLNGGDLAETRKYCARPSGDSLVSGISQTAQDVLDIEHGTELQQFVDYQSGAVILVPEGEEGD